MSRPRILVACDFYLPGYKGGGVLRSVVNTVTALGEDFDWSVLTRDRDRGDAVPYPGTPCGGWHVVAPAEVMYLGPSRRGLRQLAAILRARPHDLLYLNSLFSPDFTLKLLLLRALGRLPPRPVVLAPRGELAPSALAIKPLRKRLWLLIARTIGLYRGLIWHAAGPEETAQIRGWFPRAEVLEAPDIALPPGEPTARPPKQGGTLSIVFLGRIARNKNPAGAIALLHGLSGSVTLDLYGPVEDAGYWQECQQAAASLPPNIRVVVHGALPHDQVAGVLARHDLLLLPSLGESFGQAIAEALAAGCPALVSDRTPWHELERQGAGWALPLARPELFRQRLQALIAMEEAEHQVLRAGARAASAAASEQARGPTRLLFLDALGARA
jgi:glycosyltransferase involved in cell wall biosynthesis